MQQLTRRTHANRRETAADLEGMVTPRTGSFFCQRHAVNRGQPALPPHKTAGDPRGVRDRSLMATQGPNEKAVRTTLRQLEISVVDDARGRLAVTLAKALDGDAGMATAAISRELRATLSELEGRGNGDTNDELGRFLAELSTPVVDATNRPPNARWESRADR